LFDRAVRRRPVGMRVHLVRAGLDRAVVPSAVVLASFASFAFFATWVVAKRGFRGDRKD
jgi:hypothetical protein